MRLGFLGTSSFAAKLLEAILPHVSCVCVGTRPDRPSGRSLQLHPSPVKEIAQRHHLPLLQPERFSSEDGCAQLRAFDIDLLLVVALGEILKPSALSIPRLGSVNVHPSLLPKYRGAAPLQWALWNGDRETGVTLFSLSPQIDAGGVLLQEKILIDPEWHRDDLEREALDRGITLVLTLWNALIRDDALPPAQPQDATAVTQAPKITTEQERIDWTLPTHTIFNHIRALSPKPGTWCTVEANGVHKRLKILRASSPIDTPRPDAVRCGDGRYLPLVQVQPEAGKILNYKSWKNGVRGELHFF